MSSGLKVIALISGGKDSLFSILHCAANGHEIVALANLHPAASCQQRQGGAPALLKQAGCLDTSNDIESYMYQTIGHDIIPLYQKALALPLYRQTITGTAVNKEKSYTAIEIGPSDDSAEGIDEVESLIPLLKRVIVAHPEANAVSTGAILSDYQRTRVENVAVRLGLIPLSYLWQYPNLPPYTQTSLLEDIAAVCQDARIIKVASGGLGTKHLWLNVADPRAIKELIKSMGRFDGLQGGALLGEGGEFETLAIDGPRPLWKFRIAVLEEDRTVLAGGGGTFALRISNARTSEKTASPSEQRDRSPRIPDVLDREFAEILQLLNHKEWALKGNLGNRDDSYSSLTHFNGRSRMGNTHFMTNLIGIDNLTDECCVERQMEGIKLRLEKMLADCGSNPDSIAFTTILLRSMVDFATVNRSYAGWFKMPNPPARITVACGDMLPDRVHVMMSVIAECTVPALRRGLHVQSRSYWAPANIGPYSQAVAVPLHAIREGSSCPEMVYIAGQIPLVPSSMDIVSTNFLLQTVLSLQHLWRIGRAMRVNWWTSAIAFITASSSEQAQERAALVSATWVLAHESPASDNRDHDVGNSDDDIHSRNLHRPWGRSREPVGNIITERPPLPAWTHIDCESQDRVNVVGRHAPACFVAEIAALPRGASIEWSSLGLASLDRANISWASSQYSCEVKSTGFRMKCIEIANIEAMEELTYELLKLISPMIGLIEIYAQAPLPVEVGVHAQAVFIPCKSIWGSHGQALYAAVRYRTAS